MSKKIDSDASFLASLDNDEFNYFIARESIQQPHLQSALLHLSRGLSEVYGLNGQAQGRIRPGSCSDASFRAGLTKGQRDYFMVRESDQQKRLQSALLRLSQGVSEVSGLNGESQGLVLHEKSKETR